MADKYDQDVFEKAADHARGLRSLDQATMLSLYGLYKQATIGQCNIAKPSFWDLTGKSKWESWKKLSNMESDHARIKYIELVKQLDPEWDESKKPNKSEKEKSQGMGIAVSTMLNKEEDLVSDADKTAFDWCKEGNVEEVSRLASTKDFSVNSQDENGMSLLHWSCDRGHSQLVNLLVDLRADINQQDSELQTPLHYAAVCEHEDIVIKLLTLGADPKLVDDAGLTPFQSTSSKRIKDTFTRNYNTVS